MPHHTDKIQCFIKTQASATDTFLLAAGACLFSYYSPTPCRSFTFPQQAWTAPAQGRMQWKSEEAMWPASPPRRCAARPSLVQPALSITVIRKHWLQKTWQNSSTLGLRYAWSHHNRWRQAPHIAVQLITKCKRRWCKYLVWVSEGILIHHIARCENSGSRSERIDAALNSSCRDREAQDIRPKVHNLRTDELLRSVHWYCNSPYSRMQKSFYLPSLWGSCYHYHAMWS